MLNVSFVADDITACASSPVTITVNDLNDNKHLFNPSLYEAFVEEDIGNGMALPGVQLSVTDMDQVRR